MLCQKQKRSLTKGCNENQNLVTQSISNIDWSSITSLHALLINVSSDHMWPHAASLPVSPLSDRPPASPYHVVMT